MYLQGKERKVLEMNKVEVVKIVKHGANYTVAFSTGAIRHFFGNEEEVQKKIEKTIRRIENSLRIA